MSDHRQARTEKRRRQVEAALKRAKTEQQRIKILDKFAHMCIFCDKKFQTDKDCTKHEKEVHEQ